MKRPLRIASARADGEHLALRRLFLGGIGDDDAAGGCFLGLDSLQQNPILQWPETWHQLILH
jgi:hypothetical protein